MGQRIARMFDAGTDAAIERFKRIPKEADEADLDDFADATAEILQRWLPDSELGPYGKLMVSATFIVGQKWVGAEKVQTGGALLTLVPPARDADTTAPTPPPPPPPAPAAPAPTPPPATPPVIPPDPRDARPLPVGGL